MIKKLEEAVNAKGVRVFISRHICSLLEVDELRKRQITPPVVKVDPEKCTGCLICVNQFGCPAIMFDDESKKAFIDQSTCRGCETCIEVCPSSAIYKESE